MVAVVVVLLLVVVVVVVVVSSSDSSRWLFLARLGRQSNLSSFCGVLVFYQD